MTLPRCINDTSRPCCGCGCCVVALHYGIADGWVFEPERLRLLMFDPGRKRGG